MMIQILGRAQYKWLTKIQTWVRTSTIEELVTSFEKKYTKSWRISKILVYDHCLLILIHSYVYEVQIIGWYTYDDSPLTSISVPNYPLPAVLNYRPSSQLSSTSSSTYQSCKFKLNFADRGRLSFQKKSRRGNRNSHYQTVSKTNRLVVTAYSRTQWN